MYINFSHGYYDVKDELTDKVLGSFDSLEEAEEFIRKAST